MRLKKILIVDEDRATRDSLQRLFISRGWEVAMVTTQAEGLSLLSDYDPDWIVIPWEQLEGTGERFMAELGAKARKPKVALLIEPMDKVSSALAGRLKPDVRFRKPIVAEDVFRACEPCWEARLVLAGGPPPQPVARAV